MPLCYIVGAAIRGPNIVWWEGNNDIIYPGKLKGHLTLELAKGGKMWWEGRKGALMGDG